MALERLTIQRCTAFEDATFDLAPGVNAFIGVNGTGKSHARKLLSVLHETTRQYGFISEGSGGEAVDGILRRFPILDALAALHDRELAVPGDGA